MDLFESAAQQNKLVGTPLAEELRPRQLSEMIGQEKVLGKNSIIREMIDKDRVVSLLIWGPPGCGKTTFARALARQIQGEFFSVSAITTGAKDIREYGQRGYQKRIQYGQKTILFIDEIHRLNKAQQDVLLPYVESGDLILIGATTENPSFSINSALLSRCRLLVFESLSDSELLKLLERGTESKNCKLEKIVTKESLERILSFAQGDARKLLNSLESILYAYLNFEKNTNWPLNVEDLEKLLGDNSFRYDRKSDQHYDTISAFIKSIRGSDPDAGLYYLARMIKSGEDPMFIARRLVILASEDVSNADPKALPLAMAGLQSVQSIGLPECGIMLAQVVVYLACAPKSNSSYIGYNKALSEVDQSGALEIPLSIRNAQNKMMKNLGYGKGYNYAHDGDKGWLKQDFLPDQIKYKKFYDPNNRGYEKKMVEYLNWMKGVTPSKSQDEKE